MARRGYRVVSCETYGIPVLNIGCYKVTYRLDDAAS
jgi:hypothetical protein